MIDLDDVAKGNTIEYNPNCPQIPDYPYRILIIGGSGSEKNTLLSLINHQTGIDKIYLDEKGPCEPNY